jgi:hypothetical protein
VLPYGTFKPHVIPRHTVRILAGPPVDLSEFEGQPIESKIMRAATDKIMTDVTALLGKLRGEDPPEKPYHPAVERRKTRTELRKLADANADGAEADRAKPDETDDDQAAEVRES